LAEKTIVLPFFYHTQESILLVLRDNFNNTIERRGIELIFMPKERDNFFRAIYSATYSHLSDCEYFDIFDLKLTVFEAAHKVPARIAAAHAKNLASDFISQLNLKAGSSVVVSAPGDCFKAVGNTQTNPKKGRTPLDSNMFELIQILCFWRVHR
jgi:hypothetical protein